MAIKTNKFIITKLPKATGIIGITKAIQESARQATLFHNGWRLEEIEKIKSHAYRGKKLPYESDLKRIKELEIKLNKVINEKEELIKQNASDSARIKELKTKLNQVINERGQLKKQLYKLQDIINKKQKLIDVFRETITVGHIKKPSN